jgi:hypothetical protein
MRERIPAPVTRPAIVRRFNRFYFQLTTANTSWRLSADARPYAAGYQTLGESTCEMLCTIEASICN